MPLRSQGYCAVGSAEVNKRSARDERLQSRGPSYFHLCMKRRDHFRQCIRRSPSYLSRVDILGIHKYMKSESFSVCLCDPMDYTVHGLLQDRILEWVAFPFSRDLPNPEIAPVKSDIFPMPAPSWKITLESGNVMAAVTICSDFGAPKNKVSHCFHCFPIYLPLT